MTLRLLTALAGLTLLSCACGMADETDPKWGHLQGRVVLEGDVSDSRPLVGDIGGKNGIRNVSDESLVVDDKTNGIQNVIVYLHKKPSSIHPELIRSREKTVKFQAMGGRFVPHALLVRTDQEIEISSPDLFAYNVHEYPIKNAQHGYIVQPGPRRVRKFQFPERFPVRVGCDIHPWMQAWWVVLDHPYASITDKDGSFEIKNLPAGEHDVTVWQEKVGYIRPIATEKYFKLRIVADESTSLEVTVPVSMFQK